MRKSVTAFLVIAALAFVVGCIEEIKPKVNQKPNVWLINGPKNGETVYEDGVDFEWGISDFDDDMGKGKVFVRFYPDSVRWYNPDKDSFEIFLLTYRNPLTGRDDRVRGWMRWYPSIYRWTIRGLPDSLFTFEVRAEDGRGADSTLSVRFWVRFDKYPPEIDSVVGLPPAKLLPQNYTMNVTIYAHDKARTRGAETPPNQIQYQFTLRGPSGFGTVETDWSTKNVFNYTIDGQKYQGEYKFRYRVRDRAGNTSPEFLHTFSFGSS